MSAETIAFIIKQLVSKKFLVWVVATIAMFSGFIEGTDWLIISATFVGVQGVLDWKRGPTQTTVTASSNEVIQVVSTTETSIEKTPKIQPKSEEDATTEELEKRSNINVTN